jgi:acyl-coenzyme A synthetase/AMP-(fatty) acid ligase
MLGSLPVDVDHPFFVSVRNGLEKAGVRPEAVVGLVGLSPAETLLATVVAWHLDLVPFPAPSSSSVSECDFVVSMGPGIGVGGGLTDRRGLNATGVLHETSGSTGPPKVARRSLDSILTEAEGYRAGLGLAAKDDVRVPVPVDHSFGWGVAISALMSGCHVNASPIRLASRLARELDSGEVSKVVMTPQVARLATEARRTGTPRLSVALVGAGKVTADLAVAFLERFGVTITVGYGSTETGGTFLGASGIGSPIKSVSVLAPPVGSRGELVLRLAWPPLGYLGEPPSEGSVWRTGDIVDRAGDGIQFVGRNDSRMRLNSRFVNVDGQIAVLRNLAAVDDFAFMVLPGADRPEVEELYAVVETRTLSSKQIGTALATAADRDAPCRVFTCERFPRNAVGKPNRAELVRLIRTGRS